MPNLPDRYRPRSSLRVRFALGAVGVVLTLALVLSLAVDRVLSGAQWRSISSASQRTAMQLAAAFGLGLSEVLGDVRQLAVQPGLGRGIPDPAAWRAGLAQVSEARSGIAWMGVTDPQGRVVAATRRWFEGEDMSARTWFQEGLDSAWFGWVEEPALLALQASSSGVERLPGYFAAAAPVLDAQGRRTGVVVALLDETWLALLVHRLVTPAMSAGAIEILLRDARGLVLAGNLHHKGRSLDLGPAEAELRAAQVVVVRWPDGQDCLTVAAPVGPLDDLAGPGWQVLLRQPMAQARASATQGRLAMLAATALTTVVMMGLAVWLAGRWSAPIRRLAESADRIRHGQAPGFPDAVRTGRDEVGRLGQALHHLHDTLNRRLQDLQQSADRYRALFEHAPDAVLVHRHGAIAEANRAATLLLGAAHAGELIGRPTVSLFDPADLAHVWAPMAALPVAGGASPLVEARLTRIDDARVIEVDATASAFLDGPDCCLHIVLRDITARKAQERRLAEQQALLDQTGRMGRVGGWRHELATGMTQWTNEISRMYDWDEHVPRSRSTAISVFRGEARAQINAAFMRLIQEGQPYDLELPCVTATGRQIWVRASAQPVREGGQIVAVEGLTQDITERKVADLALRALQAELERRVQSRTAALSAANAELDSFAYAVSHDLRAPLRAMSGFARALAEDHGDVLPDQARGYLDQITRASQRMGELIDALLALSRITRGVQREDDIDLSALAQHVREELAAQAPTRRATWEIQPGLRLRGDRRMMDVLMSNLLGNAWKYTSRCAETHIRVASVVRDGRTWIEVADNGAGFDPAHAERLFQPFQRLHRQDEFRGLGIGLATAWRIVRRHGGAIEADGQVGRGATFRFTLDGEAGRPAVGTDPVETHTSTQGSP